MPGLLHFPSPLTWPSSPRAAFAKGLRIQWPRRTCLNTTCLGLLEIIFQEPGSLLAALSPHHRGNCTEIRNGKKKAGPCCQLFLFRYTLKIHILFSPGHQVLPFLPRKVLPESLFDLNFTWFYLSNGNRKLDFTQPFRFRMANLWTFEHVFIFTKPS